MSLNLGQLRKQQALEALRKYRIKFDLKFRELEQASADRFKEKWETIDAVIDSIDPSITEGSSVVLNKPGDLYDGSKATVHKIHPVDCMGQIFCEVDLLPVPRISKLPAWAAKQKKGIEVKPYGALAFAPGVIRLVAWNIKNLTPAKSGNNWDSADIL